MAVMTERMRLTTKNFILVQPLVKVCPYEDLNPFRQFYFNPINMSKKVLSLLYLIEVFRQLDSIADLTGLAPSLLNSTKSTSTISDLTQSTLFNPLVPYFARLYIQLYIYILN